MMKNIFFIALALTMVACGAAPEGEQVEAQDAVETTAASSGSTKLAINTEASQINWIGAKFTGDQHTGTINISNGEVVTENGQLTGGNFTIDMGSITNTDDMPDEMKAKLVGHLSSADFFEVENYGTAAFEIANVAPVEGVANVTHNITGNLTMKDITKSITIPAFVSVMENKLEAKTVQFVIDRTQWGVNFNSATATGALKDKAIKDEIALQIKLATK